MNGLELAFQAANADIKQRGLLRQPFSKQGMQPIGKPMNYGELIQFQNANLQIGTSDPEDIIYALPQYDELLQDLEIFDSEVLRYVPKDPGSGIGALHQTRTASGTDWHDGFVQDNAARAPVTGSYGDTLFRHKNLYRSLGISNPLIAMGQKLINIKLTEISKQMEELQEVITKGFFYGDETTYAQEWDGLVNLCDSGQIIDNTATNGGGLFSYDKFKEAFDAIDPGYPDAIIMTKECQRAFSDVMEDLDLQRLLQVGEMRTGFLVTHYMNVPIITCKQITNTQTYNGTTTTNWESGGLCTSIFFVKWSKVRFEELLPIKLFELGLSTALRLDYDLWGMRTLKLLQKYGLSILQGIKPTATTTT